MRILIAMVLLAGCEIEDICDAPEQSGPGLTGSATYSSGDGSQLAVDLDKQGSATTSASTITIKSGFTDAFSHTRSFELRVTDVRVGTFDLDGRSVFCMRRMTNGSEVCSPVTGTIEIRVNREDCIGDVGACAQDLDFTIHAASTWETTQLTLDGIMATTGMWVTEEC